MKKITLLLTLLTISFGYSQNLPLDFSSADQIGSVGDGASSSIVKDGDNDVLELVGAKAAWDHAKFTFTKNVDLSDNDNNTISFKIKPVNGTGGGNHLLKFEDGIDGPATTELAYTTTGTEWQTITLDFPEGLGNYGSLIFFVDSGDAGAGFSDTYLVDDIKGGTLVSDDDVVEKPNLPLDFSSANHLGTVGDGASSSIVKDGDNDVLQLVGAKAAWDHAKFEFKNNVDLSDNDNNTISFRIKPVNGTGGGNHLLKFEDGTGGPANTELAYTTTGTEWQTITLDFPEGLGNYGSLIFFVDSGNDGAGFSDTYLVDDIKGGTLVSDDDVVEKPNLPLDFSSANHLGTVGDGASSSIVKDGDNDVLQLVGAKAAWDHAKFEFKNNVDLSDNDNNTISFKIKPVNGTGGGNHLLKFEDGIDGPAATELAYTTTGTEWQTITLDFPEGLGNYGSLIFFVDSGNDGAGFSDTYLVDDIKGGTLVSDDDVVEKPASAAPVPSIADGNAYSIYNDTNGYTSTFPVSYSFGEATDVDLDDGTDVNNALKVDLSEAGFGQGEGGPDDVSEYNYVNFNYWYSGTSGFRFVMIDNDGSVGEFHYEIGSVAEGDQADIVSETWTQLSIPMSFFINAGMDSSKLFQWKVDRYRVDSNNGGLLFLDNIILTKNNILSVEDTNTFKSIIYPNPTSSRLTISAPKIINNAAIYNLLGKQVMSKEVNKTSESLDVSNLSPGVYLIRYTVDNAVETSKFIKQ